MGEAGGRSLLLLSEEECAAIYQACLPKQQEDATRKIMEEAILKEIDNIISATVITQFSNVLGLSIYGGVPHLSTFSSEDIPSAITQNLKSAPEYFLTIDTRFLFENTSLQPHFFWILSIEFLNRIRTCAADSQIFKSTDVMNKGKVNLLSRSMVVVMVIEVMALLLSVVALQFAPASYQSYLLSAIFALQAGFILARFLADPSSGTARRRHASSAGRRRNDPALTGFPAG